MHMRLPRRGGEPTPPPSPPPHVVEPLEPIRILLKDADLAGFVRPQTERTTDTLQRGTPISFLPGGARSDEWIDIEPSEILLVVPPPLVRRPWLVQRRQPQQVMLRVGPYTVVGIAHLQLGHEQDLMLRATRPFLPLTDATFSRADDPDEHRAETVIVNLKWVDELHAA